MHINLPAQKPPCALKISDNHLINGQKISPHMTKISVVTILF